MDTATNTVAQLEPITGELVEDLTPTEARERAEQRVTAIRTAFEVAVELLIAAWRDGDAIALGYGTGPAGWAAYIAGEFDDLRVTLPEAIRHPRLVAMRRAGMPVSAIKATPGAGSQGLVAKDLKHLREAGLLVDEEVRSFDGAKRSATAALKAKAAPVAPTGPPPTVVDQVVTAAEVLIASGRTVTDVAGVTHALAAGVTTLDLMAKLKWRQGPASVAQSRAVKRGRLVWSGTWRDGFAVYGVPRPALEAGPA